MKLRRSFALYGLICLLNLVALAEETAPKPSIFAPAFAALKKSDGVYERNISAPEKLKRERENVEANRESLSQLRVLLKSYPQGWGVRMSESLGQEKGLQLNSNMREFARLLVRESNVRLADGDATGAMDSRMDSFQLAISYSRSGMLIDALVSEAMEYVTWQDIEKIGSRLDGKSCLEYANRIDAIRRSRPPLAEVIRNEKAYSLAEFHKQFNAADWKKALEAENGELTPEEKAKLLAFSPDKMEANLNAAFETLIANASVPYSQFTPDLEASDEYVQILTSHLARPEVRFGFERSETRSRLVQSALLIRARQLGDLSAAEFARLLPLDPFSGGPLKLKGNVVYSIGPDGEEDGGQPFKNVWRGFDAKTGQYAKANSNAPQHDSVGDIIGPDFIEVSKR